MSDLELELQRRTDLSVNECSLVAVIAEEFFKRRLKEWLNDKWI